LAVAVVLLGLPHQLQMQQGYLVQALLLSGVVVPL